MSPGTIDNIIRHNRKKKDLYLKKNVNMEVNGLVSGITGITGPVPVQMMLVISGTINK